GAAHGADPPGVGAGLAGGEDLSRSGAAGLVLAARAAEVAAGAARGEGGGGEEGGRAARGRGGCAGVGDRPGGASLVGDCRGLDGGWEGAKEGRLGCLVRRLGELVRGDGEGVTVGGLGALARRLSELELT